MDDPQINEAVRTGLSQEWSPEQIAGRQQRDHPNQPSRCVSRQTIYRWLETCEYRSHFRSFLRHGRYRKRRGMDGRGHIRNRTSIEERPAEADSRRRFGDWEGDTVHGAGHSGMIMTCVERKSGYLVAAKMKDGTSARLNAAKERAFRSVPQKLRQTLTVDNGKEFAGHERLSQRLAMTIYFAHPYSSNEREHQRPAASVLPKEDRLPRHLSPRPCTRDRATQQSTTKETQLSHPTRSSQQSRLCTSDVNPR